MATSLPTGLQIQTRTQTRPAKFLIDGGHRLSGQVSISGSKNSSLPILAAALLSPCLTVLRGVPDLSDTRAMAAILRSVGARVERTDGGDLLVDADGVHTAEPSREDVGRIRAGFFVLGPLLARFGEADVALPGGCDIGARPVDIYLRGLEAMGAVVEMSRCPNNRVDLHKSRALFLDSLEGKVHARAANCKGLVGCCFRLAYPSVGATETLMMAASMADGVTVLTNVAWEPEVVDLAEFLTASGACIEGAGTSVLTITGRKRLYGAEHTIIPDRIEAGTFMTAAAIARSCITLSPVIPSHLISVAEKLSAAGCKITQTGGNALEISAVEEATGGILRGFNIKTLPYPGFPTDLQPQFMALLTTCAGSSTVVESVFENRMHHVEELRKLGAEIEVDGNSAFIKRKKPGAALSSGQVSAADLRGGAALVLAGLAAAGVTEVAGAAHIDRGYENLEVKLRSLGADIKRELH